MKRIKKNPLNTKVRPGTYFLCLLLSFIITILSFLLWLVTGLGIALSDGYVNSYLESDNFIQRHEDEHLTVRVCSLLKQLLNDYFGAAFFILLVTVLFFAILLWFASRKNSYAFVKFFAAISTSSGLLMILLPALCLILGVHSSVRLANSQNTTLFSAYIKSSMFILIALGVALLALAFLAEYGAATITKKRKQAYIAKHIDTEKII